MRRIALWVLAACASCGDDAPAPAASSSGGGVDAGEVDAGGGNTTEDGGDATWTCDPAKPFGPPVEVNGLRSNANLLRLSADGTVFYSDYFYGFQLFTARRAGGVGSFKNPLHLAELDGELGSANASVTGDGLVIYFDQTARTDAGSLTRMFVATRASTSDPFSTPQPLAHLSSAPAEAMEDLPFVLPDRSALYFTVTRSDHGSVEVELWRSPIVAGVPSAAARVEGVAARGQLALTPDERTIYFDHDGGISVARRAASDAAWEPAVPIPELVGGGNPSFVTADGCTLFYRNGQKLLLAIRGDTNSQWKF